ICSGCRSYTTNVSCFRLIIWCSLFFKIPALLPIFLCALCSPVIIAPIFIEPLFSPGIVAPVGIRPLISPLVTGSGIASVIGSRWSSRGRVSGGRRGPRTNTARPWLCHRRRNHCQANCERRDEEKFSHAVSYIYHSLGFPLPPIRFIIFALLL